MTRVRNSARGGRAERPPGVRTNHKRKPFKVVLESITQEKKKFRTVASYNAEPPAGYLFVPVGYPDLTELCKKQCQDQNLQFQTVNAKPKNKANLDPEKVSHHIHRVGNHFPIDVVRSSCHKLGYWVAEPGVFKKYNVQLEQKLSRHKNKDNKEQTRSAIQELFPKLPEKDLKEIMHHAFKKGSMRVGEAREMPLIRRVQLAVSAHARHNFTNYDKLLKQVTWEEARAMAEQPTLKQLKAWRGEDFDNHETEEVFRELIIIDSDSDDLSDDESDDSVVSVDSRDASVEFVAHTNLGYDRTDGLVRDVDYFGKSRRREYEPVSPRAGFYDTQRQPNSYYGYAPPSGNVSRYAPPTHASGDMHDPRAGYRQQPEIRNEYRPPLERASLTRHTASYNQGPLYAHDGHGRNGGPLEYAQQPVLRRSPFYYPSESGPSNLRPSTHIPPRASDGRPEYEIQQMRAGPANLRPQISPDVALPSVETDLPLRSPLNTVRSPRPQMRLQTDHNGQTVIVGVNEQYPRTSLPQPQYDAPHHLESWPRKTQGMHPNMPKPTQKFDASTSFHFEPSHHQQSSAIVDLTHNSPPRRQHQPASNVVSIQRDSVTHFPRDSQQSQQMEQRSGQDQLLHSNTMWKTYRAPPDGWPVQQDPVRAEHLHNYDLRRAGPNVRQEQVMEDIQRPAQLSSRLTSYSRIPVSSHQADQEWLALQDAPDGRVRKPQPKRHHLGRSRYHDHDSSALREDQPLDYR